MSVRQQPSEPTDSNTSGAVCDYLNGLDSADIPTSAVDNQRVESQLARAGRWRYPDWPEVCETAERRRRKSRHLEIELVQICVGKPEMAFPLRKTARASSFWLISMAAHLLILFTLGAYTMETEFAEPDDALIVISGGRAPEDPRLQLQVVEASVPSPVNAPAHARFIRPISTPSEVIDPGQAQSSISLVSFVDDLTGPVGDVQALFGEQGSALATAGTGQAGAEFFGVRAKGTRFVFIVDASLSMQDGNRWYEANRELLAALDRLEAHHQFYVMFFNKDCHRMFDANNPEPAMLPATVENRERFRQWLATVKLGYFTEPCKSVQFALSLEPDAIYLLSDGDFEDQTAAMLRRTNLERVRGQRKGTPRAIVHTIGFHSHDGQQVLKRIAQENGGRYLFVPPPNLARVARPGR
jgi:hypothetical protein